MRKDSGNFFPATAVPISARDTMLPDDVESLRETRSRIQANFEPMSPSKTRRHEFSQFLNHSTSEELEPRRSSPIRNEIDEKIEENPTSKMNVSKKLELLIERVSEFTSAHEYSKLMAIDDIQWTQEAQMDIPDLFKAEINNYINSGASTALRLQRKVSGYHGCLWYIINNRLLIWFFETNRTLECTFSHPIQDVGRRALSRVYFAPAHARHHGHSLLRDCSLPAERALFPDDLHHQRPV
jgi:hypothetical protein